MAVKRRTVLAVLLGAAGITRVNAQANWRRVAVPYVTPQAWLQSIDERWTAPRTAAFAQAAQALARSLEGGCTTAVALQSARAAWREALLTWEPLAALMHGALLDRPDGQSWAHRLDFQPARPAAPR
jgi:uncharacterized protein